MSSNLWTEKEIEILKKMYNSVTLKELSNILGRTECAIRTKGLNLGLKKEKIPKRCSDYFDKIDTPNKAYWIGFLWSDGYVWIRNRNNKTKEYGFKLDLCSTDEQHLYKMKNDMGIETSIKFYKQYKSSFKSENGINRISCYDKHLVLMLQEKYGIIPNRNDCKKLIENIPKKYIKDFIRGIIEADGSFTKYISTNRKNNKKEIKYSVVIGGTESLLKFIENVFIEKGILNNIDRKFTKRHKEDGKDGCFLTLNLSGKNNFYNILNWIYDDAKIYLNRKYCKYLKYYKEDYNEDKMFV